MRSVNRPGCVVLGLVLAVGLTGCGSDDDTGPEPGQRVDGSDLAAKVDAAAGRERYVRFRTTTPVDGEVSRIDQVVVSPKRTDFRGTSDSASVRFVDGSAYLALPDAPDQWHRDRPSDPPTATDTVRSFAAAGPQERAAVFRRGRTTFVGSEQRAGRDVRHYRTTVSPAKALATYLPTRPVGGLRSQAGDRRVTYDTWLDSENRPVRIRLSVPDAAQPKHRDVMDTTFERWGVPVTVKAPPASQVSA